MSIALRGNLEDFGISEVFQLIGQQRKTGILEVVGHGQRIQLNFDAGAIVSAAPVGPHGDWALGEMLVRVGWLTRERLAELEAARKQTLRPLPRLLEEQDDLSPVQLDEIQTLLTQETLFTLLRWEAGSFHFSAQPVVHDRPQSRLLAAEQVLMEGLRMVDEWQTFADRVPSDEVVFQRIGRFESRRDRFPADSERLRNAERLFLLVDGRLSVRRLIDLSRLGTFEGARLLAELRDLGLIEPLDPAVVARHRRGRVRSVRRPLPASPVRRALTTGLPLLLLAAVASLAHSPAGLPRPGGAHRIQRDALAEAHLAFAAQRLRNALEAHRFATGAWPRSLRELVDHGWVEESALAAPNGRPYYYVGRDEGYLLLAPEP